MCFGLGWSGGPISLDLTYNYQMFDCYKNMLTDMGSWLTAWKGPDAKYIDGCKASLPGGNIVIKTWELSSAAFTKTILGGTNTDSSVGCISLF